MKRILAALVALGMMVASGGVSWAAEKVNNSVTVTGATVASKSTATYSGNIESSKGKCAKGRRGKLYHDNVDAPSRTGAPDYMIGSFKTDNTGQWELVGNSPPLGDKVYALIAAKKIRNSDGKVIYTCKMDFSPLYEPVLV